MDVKQHRTVLIGTGHSLSLICQPTSEDVKLYIIIIWLPEELKSCVKVEVDVLGTRP